MVFSRRAIVFGGAILIVAVLGAGMFLLRRNLSPVVPRTGELPNSYGAAEGEIGAPPAAPRNAFGIPPGGEAPPPPPSEGYRRPAKEREVLPPPQTGKPTLEPPLAVFGVPPFGIPSAEEIIDRLASESVRLFPATPVGNPDILPLPPVDVREIAVSPTGATSTLEYVKAVILRHKEIKFDMARFWEIVSYNTSTLPSPAGLVDRGLAGESSPLLARSVQTYKEFLQAKIEFEKSIPVAVGIGIVEDVAVFVSFEKLTIELFEKFQAYESGAMSRADFEAYYGKYRNTAGYYSDVALANTGLIASSSAPAPASGRKRERGFLADLLDLFMFRTANATPPLIGGNFVSWFPCWCPWDLGEHLVVAGVDSAFLFRSWFTPTLFAFRVPNPGNLALGIYVPISVPCLIAIPAPLPPFFICIPTGLSGAPVLELGTSAVPSN